MSKYGIQNGLLTNTISIGRINEEQDAFLDKEDHTDAAIYAVATHVLHKYGGKYAGNLGNHGIKITVTPKENLGGQVVANDTTITIIGNLVADAELRFTPNGAAVANFTIASTPRTFDRTTGEWKEGATLFLRASLWREAAENAAETLKKGMRVIAQGNLRMRQYETKEGERRTSMELEVEEIGPSLRFASANVNRNQRNGSNFGGSNYTAPPAQNGYAARAGAPQGGAQPQGQNPQGGAPQADPWAQQAQGNYGWGQGTGDDTPPF